MKPLPTNPIACTMKATVPVGTSRQFGVLYSNKTYPTPKVVTLGSALRFVEGSIIPTEQTAAPQGAQMWGGLDADMWGPDALTETMAAFIQYRVGGNIVSFCMDWLAGSYQLPPCERVDVFAIARLTTAREVSVAVVDGSFQGVRTPTLTGATNATAAVAVPVGAPACAKGMEVWGNAASNIVVTSTGSWSPLMRRDTTAYVYSPPWSPVDFDDRQRSDLQFSVLSDVTQKVCVRFYLGV